MSKYLNDRYYPIVINSLLILGMFILVDLVFLLKEKNKDLNTLYSENLNLKNVINFKHDNANTIKNTILLYFNSNKGTEINAESYIKILSDQLTDSIRFEDIQIPVLVFYFTGFTCSSCVTEAFKLLGQTMEIYPNSKVIILTPERMNSNLEGILKRVIGRDITIYIKDMNQYFPDQNKSYFFLLSTDDSLLISNCFSPNIDDPEITKAYLESILSAF